MTITAISVDLWGTLAFQPTDFDSQIVERISAALLERFPDVDRRNVEASIRQEGRLFSNRIQQQKYSAAPPQRLKEIVGSIARFNAMSLEGIDCIEMSNEIDELLVDHPPSINAHLVAFMRQLRALGIPISIVSNTGWISSRACRVMLESRHLAKYFQNTYFSDAGYRPKPDPAMFEAMLADIGRPGGDVLHIGDDPTTDLSGARAAGIRACLLKVGRKKRSSIQLHLYARSGRAERSFDSFDGMWDALCTA